MKPSIVFHQTPLEAGVGMRWWAETALDRTVLYARTPFSPVILDHLQRMQVVIVGVGSGGSKIALDLAKAGVGGLRLVDPGLVQIHNTLRHLATLEDTGRPKVEVVAEQVLLHNPFVVVETYAVDAFQVGGIISPRDIFAGVNLIIAATDKVSVQLQINTEAWHMGIPAVFGGCYESARGGEVLFTLPGEATPCLACLRAGLKQPTIHGAFEYSAARSLEDYRGEPGLSAAVDLVTDVETQIALGILLRGTGSALADIIVPAYNFWLVGGALAADYYLFKRPFHIFIQPLAGSRPDCDICQTRQPPDLPARDDLNLEDIPEEYRSLLD